MIAETRNLFAATGFAFLMAATGAWAQQPSTRMAGTILAVEGAVFVVRAEKGEVRVSLSERARVMGVEKVSLNDLKKGDFIGVGAMPQADGSQRAIQVTIFSESQRGTGEGHRPWNRPNSTMTNATVDAIIADVDGRVLMVKYKDGEKKIIVPPDALILRYVEADRSELKPGAAIAISGAEQKPDGSLETSRVNVGRGGYAPQ